MCCTLVPHSLASTMLKLMSPVIIAEVFLICSLLFVTSRTLCCGDRELRFPCLPCRSEVRTVNSLILLLYSPWPLLILTLSSNLSLISSTCLALIQEGYNTMEMFTDLDDPQVNDTMVWNMSRCLQTPGISNLESSSILDAGANLVGIQLAQMTAIVLLREK
jgi:hypothetical protein